MIRAGRWLQSAVLGLAIALGVLLAWWAITSSRDPLSPFSSKSPSIATPRPPLFPVSSDPAAEIAKDPIIRSASGAERRRGEIYLLVHLEFDNAHLMDFSSDLQLIQERVTPGLSLRYLLVRVPEDELMTVHDALKLDPDVDAVGLNFIDRPFDVAITP